MGSSYIMVFICAVVQSIGSKAPKPYKGVGEQLLHHI